MSESFEIMSLILGLIFLIFNGVGTYNVSKIAQKTCAMLDRQQDAIEMAERAIFRDNYY